MTSIAGTHRQGPGGNDPSPPATSAALWWTYPNTDEGRDAAHEEIARRDTAGNPVELSLRGFAASGEPPERLPDQPYSPALRLDRPVTMAELNNDRTGPTTTSATTCEPRQARSGTPCGGSAS